MSVCQSFWTPLTISTFVEEGQAKAAAGIKGCGDTKALITLFIKTAECFDRTTRNKAELSASDNRAELLHGAIKSASSLCAQARHIRQTMSDDQATELMASVSQDIHVNYDHNAKIPPMPYWVDSTKTEQDAATHTDQDIATHVAQLAEGFFLNHSRDTLPTVLIDWLDAKMTAAEQFNRSELITAMQTMFAPAP